MAISSVLDFMLMWFFFILFCVHSTLALKNYEYRLWSTGDHLRASEAFEGNPRSSVHCGVLCSQRRNEDGVQQQQTLCEAFSYNSLDRRCQLYTAEANATDASGDSVYKYHVEDNDPLDGFHYITATSQTFVLYVSSAKLTYEDAKDHCVALGSYLIELNSVEEYNVMVQFLVDQGITHRAWVGANDLEVEGVWRTGRFGQLVDFTIWRFADNEPNNSFGNEHCAVFRMDRSNLYDVPCVFKYHPLCERTP